MLNLISFSLCSEFPSNRIESVLRELFPQVSRRQFKKVLDRGLIHVNSATATRGSSLKLRDRIEFPNNLLEIKLGSERTNIKGFELEVVYEDDAFIVVNKPRKMHSVVINFDDPLTLADLVYDNYPQTASAGRAVTESGLVQRLDFYTSGLVTIAKNRESWEELHQTFLNKDVLKTYIAFVQGDISRAVPNSSFDIKTIVKNENRAIISLTTKLGGRHIVRESCANLGFPLVGDKEFGSPESGFSLRLDNELVEDEGFYLVASKIQIPAGSFSDHPLQFELDHKEISIPQG